MSRNIFRLLSLFVVAAMLLAACAQPAATTEAPKPTEKPAESVQATEAHKPTEALEPTEEMKPTEAAPAEEPAMGGMLPEVDPAAQSGNIIMAGSSTVFPLAEALAERFEGEGFSPDKGQITIDSIGTGGGFERFCSTGESDIANASRPIKDEEKANCEAIGRNPIEFRVGTDALAVVVSADNDFIEDITKEELALAFSDQVTQWSEIRPEWPAEDIHRFSPGTDSGTFDYFVEAVLLPAYEKDADKAEAAILNAANIQFSEDDNVLVQGVAPDPYAIGYFGYAYLTENEDVIKALSINGVAPSAETVDSNEYPLARPLFIYSDAAILQEKPQVAAFINFFLTYVNEEIIDVGYFPASDAALEAAMQAWLDAMGQ